MTQTGNKNVNKTIYPQNYLNLDTFKAFTSFKVGDELVFTRKDMSAN